MQGKTSVITLECLRGRLQAERTASRAAQHNVELFSIKLKELEKQLKIETKFRRKADKKLNILKKKLESMNIPINKIISEECEQSSSSYNSDISCISSIASTSLNHQEDHLQEFRGSKSSSITSEKTEENIGSETSVTQKGQDIIKCDRQELDESCHGFKQLELEGKINEDEIKENQDVNHVDNSMALVPISPIIELSNSSNNGSINVKSENAKEVLTTLEHIRQNLQSSLERRRIIKVG